MKYLLNSIAVLLLMAFMTVNVNAQSGDAEEEEVTESSEPAENLYIDDIVDRTLIYENRLLPYDKVREADIPWMKRIWRVVDTREKINLPFRFPQRPFFVMLKEMIMEGDISVFDDEKFTEMLTAEDVKNKLYSIDTVPIYDYETYEEKIEFVENEVNWEDIVKFRVKEIFFFDKEASQMKVRVLGIAPLKQSFTEEGDFKYEEALFWVYFPEVRDYLAGERVFSGSNDMSTMTWADVFDNRLYSSYVYKQSNVLDERLTDMFEGYENDGIEVLLESRKIEDELFNFEQDLWSY